MSHLNFTAEDRSFIRTILAHPGELTNWLVYADWLDEHDNPLQAEFLRLMVQRGQLTNTDPEWHSVVGRLRQLRAELPLVWVEVFDRPKIENCDSAFAFKCPKRWENLKVTGHPMVRHCDACNKDVHYCHTLPEAQNRARRGECVAVKLGVLRHPDDLKPPEPEAEVFMTGMLDPGYYPSLPDYADYPGTATTPPSPPPPAPAPPPPRKRPWWKFW